MPHDMELAAAGLAAIEEHAAPLALIIAPAGFALFRYYRLQNDRWCSLCDNLYLNAPVWIASILALALRVVFPG